MIQGSAAIRIARPVSTVYRFIAVDFYRNYPRWSPEVVALTPLSPGPWREGAMARQVRVDQGRRSDTTFRATRLEPDRRMVIDGVSAAYHAEYELEGEGEDGTLLSFRFRLDRLDLFMLPFEKLIRSALAEGTSRTARNLKGLIELECPAATTVALKKHAGPPQVFLAPPRGAGWAQPGPGGALDHPFQALQPGFCPHLHEGVPHDHRHP